MPIVVGIILGVCLGWFSSWKTEVKFSLLLWKPLKVITFVYFSYIKLRGVRWVQKVSSQNPVVKTKGWQFVSESCFNIILIIGISNNALENFGWVPRWELPPVGICSNANLKTRLEIFLSILPHWTKDNEFLESTACYPL